MKRFLLICSLVVGCSANAFAADITKEEGILMQIDVSGLLRERDPTSKELRNYHVLTGEMVVYDIKDNEVIIYSTKPKQAAATPTGRAVTTTAERPEMVKDMEIARIKSGNASDKFIITVMDSRFDISLVTPAAMARLELEGKIPAKTDVAKGETPTTVRPGEATTNAVTQDHLNQNNPSVSTQQKLGSTAATKTSSTREATPSFAPAIFSGSSEQVHTEQVAFMRKLLGAEEPEDKAAKKKAENNVKSAKENVKLDEKIVKSDVDAAKKQAESEGKTAKDKVDIQKDQKLDKLHNETSATIDSAKAKEDADSSKIKQNANAAKTTIDQDVKQVKSELDNAKNIIEQKGKEVVRDAKVDQNIVDESVKAKTDNK